MQVLQNGLLENVSLIKTRFRQWSHFSLVGFDKGLVCGMSPLPSCGILFGCDNKILGHSEQPAYVEHWLFIV